jgi:hypothetical protein
MAHAVEVAGVEQGHARVERGVDGSEALGPVGGAVEVAHAHAAEPEGGNGGAGGSELAVDHGGCSLRSADVTARVRRDKPLSAGRAVRWANNAAADRRPGPVRGGGEAPGFPTRGGGNRRVPSSLSDRLRALEEGLGTRLLNRTTRSVALTDAGAALLARLEPALAEVEAALGDAGCRGTAAWPGRCG